MEITTEQKIQELYDNYNIIINSVNNDNAWSTFYTVAGKIIVPMLQLDINLASSLWLHSLKRFYKKVSDNEYNILCDHVLREADSELIIQALNIQPKIKQYIFSLNGYENRYDASIFIANLVIRKHYEISNELLKLLFENNHGKHNFQKTLYDTLNYIAISETARWLIDDDGINFVYDWLSKISIQSDIAKIKVSLISLKNCIDGNEPRGAMPVSIMHEFDDPIGEIVKERQKKADFLTKQKDIQEDNFTSLTEINESELENNLNKLNSLIGLKSVKADVTKMINLSKVEIMRKNKGIKSADMSLHLVFSGNPGTGKTTVARLLSKIYKALGILSKGHLVEASRNDLVAEYVGQTAPKTAKVIESAMGGVLFIDEAYSLTSYDAPNDFGKEAIETLLKEMEDHRNDLIVIVAGYTNLMCEFIDSNPGLKSRFNKYIQFDDYTGEELFDIFIKYITDNEFILTSEAENLLKKYIIYVAKKHGFNFGNARDIRNIFEKIVANQANRIVEIEHPSAKELQTITPFDLIGIISISSN